MSKYILVTGSAGFIGFHLCKRLLEENFNVIGIDNVNSYYDTNLKEKRLQILSQVSLKRRNWIFFKTDLIDKNNQLSLLSNVRS